jgi:hypothetical protein
MGERREQWIYGLIRMRDRPVNDAGRCNLLLRQPETRVSLTTAPCRPGAWLDGGADAGQDWMTVPGIA